MNRHTNQLIFAVCAGLLLSQLTAQGVPSNSGEPEARIVVGVEQRGAGSTEPTQKLAIELAFQQPLSPRMAAWGDVRLSSLPRQLSSSLVTLPVETVKLAATVDVGELARSAEFLVGASYRLLGGRAKQSSLSLITSVGAITPLIPEQSRFLRQYYAGVRVQSPAHAHVIDVSVGQNEAVTGGELHGAVLRMDGRYAIPLARTDFAYLFGTVVMRAWPLHGGASGHDLYRIGAGVDFFQMLKAFRSN